MRALLFALLLMLSQTAALAEAVPVFSGFHFGDAPRDNMLCTAGPCATELVAEGHRKPNQLVAVYKLPVDATHLGGVEISAPDYFYHENRLFRVSFRILGDPDKAERCMTRLVDAFEERYGMTQLRQIFDSSAADKASLQRNYLTTAGYRVEFCRLQENGRWQPPLVSIYHPTLMDAVRLSANPDYRPDAY